MTEAIINTTVLSEMFGDDQALTRAILDQFRRSAAPYMTELDTAIATRSTAGVGALAHKLKSSSRTVGAMPLGDLCEALEQAAQDQQWPAIESLQREVQQMLQRVLAAIEGQ